MVLAGDLGRWWLLFDDCRGLVLGREASRALGLTRMSAPFGDIVLARRGLPRLPLLLLMLLLLLLLLLLLMLLLLLLLLLLLMLPPPPTGDMVLARRAITAATAAAAAAATTTSVVIAADAAALVALETQRAAALLLPSPTVFWSLLFPVARKSSSFSSLSSAHSLASCDFTGAATGSGATFRLRRSRSGALLDLAMVADLATATPALLPIIPKSEGPASAGGCLADDPFFLEPFRAPELFFLPITDPSYSIVMLLRCVFFFVPFLPSTNQKTQIY